MSETFYKPLTPDMRKQINNSIEKNIKELKTCEQNVLVNMQIQGQLALKVRYKMITLKENELYQELELFVDGEKIGEAEVEIKGKMLSRLSIFPPYQNKGYGSQIVNMLNEKYGCKNLWVNADNEKAIHVYEKNGYSKSNPTMYLMIKGGAK